MNDFSFYGVFPDVLTRDLLRYVIGAGGVYLLVNVALSAILAHRKIRADIPGWRQIRREILTSLRSVLIFAAAGTVIAAGAGTGWFRIYLDIDAFGWGWLVLSTAGVVVAHDAWFYWLHRLLHHPKLWRRMHRTHHLSHNPTPFTSYAFDLGEAFGNALFLPLFLLAVPMHPLALFIFTGHMMLRNALGHCGVEVFPAGRDGRPLFGWLTTVTHHDLHHAGGPYNFALYFTWWDRWMGTEHPRYLAEFARVAKPAAMMRPLALAVMALMLATAAATGGEARANDLRGIFATPGIDYLVRFEPCPDKAGETCGRLVWALYPGRTRHVQVGGLMIRGLRWNGRAWTDGTLQDPESGSIFGGEIVPQPQGAITLTGCRALLLCETQTWWRWEEIWRRFPRPVNGS